MDKMTKNDDELEDVEFFKGVAEEIYAHFEGLGGDIASKARRLRHANSKLIKAAARNHTAPGYYLQFTAAIDAIVVYLFMAGEPRHRDDVVNAIVEGGYTDKTKLGPRKSLHDSLDSQTKRGKNGIRNLLDDGSGMISLTPSGEKEGARLIAKHGSPLSTEETL
jgi:hypothetical protein